MTAARGAVSGLGFLLALVTARAMAVPTDDALLLVGVAFVVGIAVHAAARSVIRLLERGSPDPGHRARTMIVALVPVVSLAAGAMAASWAMFVSAHDLSTLVVTLIGAGTAGVLGALALASELRERAQEAAAAEERQRMVERSRRELVAWVSHDLRTPLAGIRAMIEALDDGVVSDATTVKRYYATMIDEADRLGRLINGLFELSRIEAEALQLASERVSVDELVSDAVATTEALAHTKGVRVDGLLDGSDRQVLASMPEMVRAVANLLDNAVRHTPPGGTVRVEVSTEDGHAVLSVVDQCGGIPDEDLDRVFDRAYRGDAARSPHGHGGGGLGLAIARGLVSAHDGDISVRNHGDGCRFTIRLPLVG